MIKSENKENNMKFRSKLKKKSGTKQVAKGQSSISNPGVTKHRAKAKGKFFQSNLIISEYSLGILKVFYRFI